MSERKLFLLPRRLHDQRSENEKPDNITSEKDEDNFSLASKVR